MDSFILTHTSLTTLDCIRLLDTRTVFEIDHCSHHPLLARLIRGGTPKYFPFFSIADVFQVHIPAV